MDASHLQSCYCGGLLIYVYRSSSGCLNKLKLVLRAAADP